MWCDNDDCPATLPIEALDCDDVISALFELARQAIDDGMSRATVGVWVHENIARLTELSNDELGSARATADLLWAQLSDEDERQGSDDDEAPQSQPQNRDPSQQLQGWAESLRGRIDATTVAIGDNPSEATTHDAPERGLEITDLLTTQGPLCPECRQIVQQRRSARREACDEAREWQVRCDTPDCIAEPTPGQGETATAAYLDLLLATPTGRRTVAQQGGFAFPQGQATMQRIRDSLDAQWRLQSRLEG